MEWTEIRRNNSGATHRSKQFRDLRPYAAIDSELQIIKIPIQYDRHRLLDTSRRWKPEIRRPDTENWIQFPERVHRREPGTSRGSAEIGRFGAERQARLRTRRGCLGLGVSVGTYSARLRPAFLAR